MDLIGEERGRLARTASWLQATPAEVTGLAVLLVCALVATGVLVWTATGRPGLDGPQVRADAGAAEVGSVAEPGGTADVHGHDAHGDDAHGDDAHGDDAHGHDAGGDHGGHGDHGTGGDDQGGPGAAASGEVTVHVAGAVASPGVVTLPAGSRVADAVEAAGGLLADADPSRTNLARPLQDGEQLLLLREGEDPPPPEAGGAAAGTGAAAGAGAGASPGTEAGPIDLNTASEAQLETLPGIGPALAARIVQHRERHGPFAAPGDLRDVSGIGEKRFQDLADLVTVR